MHFGWFLVVSLICFALFFVLMAVYESHQVEVCKLAGFDGLMDTNDGHSWCYTKIDGQRLLTPFEAVSVQR